MPIRKKGDIEIKASTNKARVKQTGYTFYSYDKNAAALYFQFREQDGQPTDLSKATVHLVMILNDDNGKQFIPGGDEIEVLSAIQGTAEYVLPDNLLGYEGKVTSYVYLDFSDGTHTDEGRFTFEIKRSLVTDVIPKAGDKYVKDFDDIKAEVQKTANSAIKTASEASKSIDEVSKEVNSAKAEAIKNMHESDISDKNYLLDSKKKVLKPRTSGEVSDTTNHTIYHLSEPIPAGVEMTISGKLEITDGDFDAISIYYRGENDASLGHGKMEISDSEFSETFTLPKKLYKIYIYAGESGKTRGNGVVYTGVKLQTGSLATPWNPNPHEIMTDLDYTDRNLIVASKLSPFSRYSTQPVIEDNGRKITINYKENQNQLVSLKVDGWKPPKGKYTLSGRIEINGRPITQETFPIKKLNLDHSDSDNDRFNVLSDGTLIATERYDESSDTYILQTTFDGLSGGDEIAFYDLQFQPGSVATPWLPSFGHYDAKIKKLEQAIINLGGSI